MNIFLGFLCLFGSSEALRIMRRNRFVKQPDEILRKFFSPLYENGLEEVTDADFNLPSLIELLKMMENNPESFDEDKDTEASRGWESQRMLDF